MNKIKFNIKDRKMLYMMLSLVLICVFTLTIAYSALSAVLTIQGNARVSAADWDIYLNNPRVTNGSATTNVPVIKTSSTLEFETTLNIPGDFYEFVVDVVNAGDIDAMIENVVKTPDLTADQAKFLKYEVSYQNGEAITTKQLLAKDTTMPIKVRIEYRNDLSSNDLPTGQVVLDLSLTLEYIQSDGSGNSILNNGTSMITFVSGDGTNVGDEVCISDECFNVIDSNNEEVKLFPKYRISVDGKQTQDGNAITFTADYYWVENGGLKSEYGDSYPAYIYDSNSPLYSYVEKYKSYLENFIVEVKEARLINLDELRKLGLTIVDEVYNNDKFDETAPEWITNDGYFVGFTYRSDGIWSASGTGVYARRLPCSTGVKPVIVISKDYFN